MGFASASLPNRQVPAAEPDKAVAPLTDRELKTLFAPISRASVIALAVSGGADSLALMACIRRWSELRRSPLQVHVFIVDHRLRPESRREAAAVRRTAQRLGFSARVLVRRGEAPEGDIEAAARKARYRLLLDAAREVGASHLLVAHHREDVAETFLMRARRGAGIFGLAAMRPVINLSPAPGLAPDLTLFRPFLAVPRARLAACVEAAGLVPVHDPMNDDPRFERTRFRRMIRSGAVDSARVSALAFRFASLAERIDAEVTAFLQRAVLVDEFAVARLASDALAAETGEVQLRALVRLLQAIGGEDHPPRFSRLSALLASMLEKVAFRRTLAGVVVEGRAGRLVLYRETGRVSLPALRLRPSESLVWDHRFLVALDRAASTSMTVGPIGDAAIRPEGVRSAGLPAGAWRALPAAFRRGKIVEIPPFSGGENASGLSVRCILSAALEQPRLFPA